MARYLLNSDPIAKKKYRTPIGVNSPTASKHLSGDAMIATIREAFGKVQDSRTSNSFISAQDALMSGFAVFSLKDPSLLAFDERRKAGEPNLHRIYGIENVPCDTQLRAILDEIDPDETRKAYQKIFAKIQRGKRLEQLTILDGHYLLSGDGTGFYYSNKISNDRCLTSNSEKTGKGYYQMFYGAALVHPDFKEVLPFPP